jgi:hypothetical protein
VLCRQLPKAAVPALPTRALSRRSLREHSFDVHVLALQLLEVLQHFTM